MQLLKISLSLSVLLFAFMAQSQQRTVPVVGNSIVLIDAKTGVLRGSATHLCPLAMFDTSGKSYFITAAHVLDLSNGVATQPSQFNVMYQGVMRSLPIPSRAFQVVRVDSSKDLALLSIDREGIAEPGCLQIPLSEPLLQDLSTAYDIGAVTGFKTHHLSLEALDVPTSAVRRFDFDAKIALSRPEGLPGREGIGRVIMVSGRAIPGNSGGVITEDEPTFGDLAPRHNVLGMVLAVDAERTQMALISANELIRFFLGAFRQPSRTLEKEGPGGVVYTDSAFIHFRGASSHLMPVGVNQDAPAGPGRLGDGGSSPITTTSEYSKLQVFASGLASLKDPTRRWLALGDWSEGEPFPLAMRPQLMAPQNLNGLYAKDGELYLTSADISLPLITDLFNDDTGTCQNDQAATKTGRVANVIVCQGRTSTTSWFGVVSNTAGIGRVAHRVSLEKDCTEKTPGPCHVILTATRAPLNATRPADVLREITRAPLHAVALEADGFRSFRAADGQSWLHVEKTGGYHLTFRSQNALHTLSGPNISTPQ